MKISSLLPLKEIISYGFAVAFCGCGLAVLQVPNPKRIGAAKVLFLLGALSASGASIMWLVNIDNGSVRALVSILAFGLIGWGAVELFRFAGHTEPITQTNPTTTEPQMSPQALPSQPSAPQAALSPKTEANTSVKTVKSHDTASRKSAASSINQTMTNSSGGMQAGRDIIVGEKPSPAPTKKDNKP
jgi:hypothetical protein